eukprot:gi/632974631/ref/XP_007903786.1/ PREDICTED: LOW QUALITY PROTEIN: poly [ADP-ribose] polymerase 4 [Callorhinchus milii]
MGVFSECVVVLDVKQLPIKEKNKLKTAIKTNDGIISYLVNQQCTHFVASDINAVSSSRLKAIQKYKIPLVNATYITSCIEADQLLDTNCYKLCEPTAETSSNLTPMNKHDANEDQMINVPEDLQTVQTECRQNNNIPQDGIQDDSENFRMFSTHDNNIPFFAQDFEVAKYSVLDKDVEELVVIELQVSQKNAPLPFRISSHSGQRGRFQTQQQQFVFTSTAEAAEKAYEWCIKKQVEQNFTVQPNWLPTAQPLASEKLQQLIIEEALNVADISDEVSVFVEAIWAEAQGCLQAQLIDTTSITLNDVTRAEGVLLQLKKAMDDKATTATLTALMSQFYTILPFKPESDTTITKKKIAQKHDLCQVIRDVLNASEATSWAPMTPSLAKFQALRCHIECVDQNSDEFMRIKKQLLNSNQSGSPVMIQQIFHVARLSESRQFQNQLDNIKPLYHASAMSNFVGILSRGLLPPNIVVESYGGERTDVGNLGSGIYFSDSISTSIKYSKPSTTDGTRLLVICDVALGKCKQYYKKDITLSAPPEGYSSVHGVHKTADTISEFDDDEFVVYSTDQVKMKYVVQFCAGGEQLKPFSPPAVITENKSPPTFTSPIPSTDDFQDSQDPLKSVKAGLQDSAGNVIPLQEVHVKAKLMDLVGEVIVFQSYTNSHVFPIEAKYVFPLDDTAAVCGFEAFINGKHIIGQVKEKQQAHREYRQAIKQGHGAYLMDQSAADVFTISIGNLPPNANVVIKITYITELSVDQQYICFLLPGNVATQQRDKALQEETQESVERICVEELQTPTAFSVELSIEMPYEIKEIKSPTHKIKIKRTDCWAVVSMEQDTSLATGFQLLILLAEIHVPRMWVENNPEKDSQACMLAFYPEFDVGTLSDFEAIICLDCSCSMQGLAFQQAKKIALLILQHLPTSCTFNVITFGTGYKELFPCSQQRNSEDAANAARHFILSAQKPMGNTDFWRPLRSLSLLAPSKRLRSVLLISDGHVQNEDLTLKTVQQNVKYNRIFTCGVGSTANRHMLRALALYGGGAYEYFDEKNKFGWTAKVESQVDRVTQPGCRSISVNWQQFNQNKPDPLQAPAQIHSIFSGSRLLVYGFVPHCTQATLSALINNQEIKTMVSTTELQKTKGKMLHRLTARALIGDYENGSLHADQSEHEMKKSIQKSYIIELSKEYSIVTQFTSFVAIEERDDQETEGVQGPSVQELAAKENVDILPYLDWEEQMLRKKRCRSAHATKFRKPNYNKDYVGQNKESDGSVVDEEEVMDQRGDLLDCASLFPFIAPLKSADRLESSDSLDSENKSESDSVMSSTISSDALPAISGLYCDTKNAVFLKPFGGSKLLLSTVPLADSQILFGNHSLPSVISDPPPSPTDSAREFIKDLRMDAAPASVSFSSHLLDFGLDLSPPMASVCSDSPSPMASASSPDSFVSLSPMHSAFSPVCSDSLQMASAPPPGGFESLSPMASAPPPVDFGSPLMASAPPPGGFGSPLMASAPPPVGLVLLEWLQLLLQLFWFSSNDFSSSSRWFWFSNGFSSSSSWFWSLLMASAPPVGSPRKASAPSTLVFDTHSPMAKAHPPLACYVPQMTAAPSKVVFPSRPPMAKAPSRCLSVGLGSRPPKAVTLISGGSGSFYSDFTAKVLMDEIQTVEESVTKEEGKKSKDGQEAKSNRCYESDINVKVAGNMQRVRQHLWKEKNRFDFQLEQEQEMSGRVNERLNVLAETETLVSPQNDDIVLQSSSNVKRLDPVALRKHKYPHLSMVSTKEDVFSNRVLPLMHRSSLRCGIRQSKDFKFRGHTRLEKENAENMLRSKNCTLPWKLLFGHQNEKGFWHFTSDLGTLLEINLTYLTDFLGKKGINSLGHRAAEEIVSLIITLLILQLVRYTQQLKGIKLKSLFRLEESLDCGPPHWALDSVKKAIVWARATERQYPGIYSRLELGRDWESATRQLLQIDPLKLGSPLQQILKKKIN